jgi:hypothetical protein
VRTAALVALLLLSGCAAPGLDGDQATETRRTCASLRERVANRRLQRFDLSPDRGYPDKFYDDLEAGLAAADLGPEDAPSPLSPATRLVRACSDLDG